MIHKCAVKVTDTYGVHLNLQETKMGSCNLVPAFPSLPFFLSHFLIAISKP